MQLIYVAARDTKNYTVYQTEDGSKLNQLYLPKGLPQRVLVTIDEVPSGQ